MHHVVNKIAVIGSGIAGLSCAWLLSSQYQVKLFEKEAEVGGHCKSFTLPLEDLHKPVDVGFLVYNDRTYPDLIALFKHLEVKTEKTDMSFGLSLDNGSLEYASSNLNSFFAQRSNILKPTFLKLSYDILKFMSVASNQINDLDETVTVEQFLNKLGLGDSFKRYFFYPMAGAIWSTASGNIGQFSALFVLRFFNNHGLLSMHDQPQWHTVSGSSRSYVEKLLAQFKGCLAHEDVVEVQREKGNVTLTTKSGNSENFDAVVFACHSDQVLNILRNLEVEERQALETIPYINNKGYLHSDVSFMPRKKNAWASWVYLGDSIENKSSLTYWINRLQNLETASPVLVTLNPDKPPEASKIWQEFEFSHPFFTNKSSVAQSYLQSIQGKNNTWYAGAYLRNGFHEDGLWSALKVANALGVRAPWQ